MISRTWHGGVSPEKDRFYPEDRKSLLGFEPTVGHYEVVFGA